MPSEDDLMTETEEAFSERLLQIYGGKEAFLASSERLIEEVGTRWAQETDAAGRILRAHLFVEHFLDGAIKARNPNLGSLSEARVSFNQKVELLFGGPEFVLSYLAPGIRIL